jgi:hypothetical protein
LIGSIAYHIRYRYFRKIKPTFQWVCYYFFLRHFPAAVHFAGVEQLVQGLKVSLFFLIGIIVAI